MRRSPGKDMGYILCPIVIPPNQDAETWLANTSNPDDGWQALGQILMALRAHDDRIEERLSDLMEIYLPGDPPEEAQESTIVCIGLGESRRANWYLHEGNKGSVEGAVAASVASGTVKGEKGLRALSLAIPDPEPKGSDPKPPPLPPNTEPLRIVSGKLDQDGRVELREQGVEREKAKPDGTPGPVNVKKTKAAGRKMLNGEGGHKIAHPRKRSTAEEREQRREQRALNLLDASKADELGISVNLLERSGLCRDKAQRSVNTLEEVIAEAKMRLEEDELATTLDAHFGIDRESAGKDSADGCTVASLLLMNAAMLHQRIAEGAWLPGIVGLDEVKAAPNAGPARVAPLERDHPP